jgi:hypothetical protein
LATSQGSYLINIDAADTAKPGLSSLVHQGHKKRPKRHSLDFERIVELYITGQFDMVAGSCEAEVVGLATFLKDERFQGGLVMDSSRFDSPNSKCGRRPSRGQPTAPCRPPDGSASSG